MSAPEIRCDHDQIQKIGSQFSAQSSAIAGVNRELKSAQSTLEGGDWIGRGATEFFKEMNSEINPAMQRLQKAMDEAAKAAEIMEQHTRSTLAAYLRVAVSSEAGTEI